MRKIIYLSFVTLFFLSPRVEGQFLLNGNASIITPQCNAAVTTYQLTPDLANQSGQIWNTTPINLTTRFDLQFEIFMGYKAYNTGADGMAFVIQTLSNNAGSGGGGLGYEGITPSIAIEFDTYENGWDPIYCHTAIEKNGDIDHTDLSGNNLAGPEQLSPSNATLPDGTWHNAEIIWNPISDSLSLYFDCSLRVSYKGDIVDSIFKGNPTVYWGFTGGTGALSNSQEVCVTNSYTITDSLVNPSCLGNDGKAIINIHGANSAFTYLWTPSGQTTATATGLSAGLYTVKFHPPGDTCAIQRDTIRLVGSHISLSSTGTMCSRTNSGTATITITNGKAPYTYAWNNGETNQTDTGLTAGKYYVTVTDNKGCRFTDSVTIHTDPAPTISTTPPINDSVCYLSGTTITGTGGVSYTWLPNTRLSCNNCASPVASPTVTTTYTVTGTDANGCTNTATLTIKVLSLPTPKVSGKDTICIGSSTVLSASGGTSYLWTPGSGTGSSYTVRPPTNTTYTVKATADGCSKDTTVNVTVVPIPRAVAKSSKDSVCVGDTLTLSGSGGTTYRWSPGNLTNAKIQVNLARDTTYTLYSYGGTCEDSTKIHLKVIQPTSASIGIDHDSICPHRSATITATGTGGTVTYKWSNGQTTSAITVNDTVTTTYTATVYGTCDSMQRIITLHVIPLPAPAISGTRFECQGGLDTITISSATNPTTYKWNNGQTGTSFIATINGDTTYTVTAYNSLGCSITDTFHVKGMTYPGAIMSYPTACGNGEITVVATPTGTGPFSYHWNTGGTNDTITVFINKDTTIFTVTISNGCPITRTETVIENNPELAACCDTTILMGASTSIIAAGPGIVNYHWSPQDGSLNCYTCPNPIASPKVTTTYTVIGTDSGDCPVERTVTIIVETPCSNFIVPNVFTPTNSGVSGLDNIFYIKTSNFNTWSLTIFDRWGHEVFKSTNPIQYWDGNTEGGEKAPAGVYYYIIDASCVDNAFKKDGFVQLIR